MARYRIISRSQFLTMKLIIQLAEKHKKYQFCQKLLVVGPCNQIFQFLSFSTLHLLSILTVTGAQSLRNTCGGFWTKGIGQLKTDVLNKLVKKFSFLSDRISKNVGGVHFPLETLTAEQQTQSTKTNFEKKDHFEG